MSSIKNFEDLKVWQKAREPNLHIYKISNNPIFSKDFGLKYQVFLSYQT